MSNKSGFASGPALRLVLFFIAIALSISSCAPIRQNLIQPSTTPLFYDDGDTPSLLKALESQYHYISTIENDSIFKFYGKKYNSAQAAESLRTFQEIIELEPSPFELDRILKENFLIIQAGGRQKKTPGEMLVTGYFEPLLEGSLTRTPPFIYPLYSPPKDLVSRLGPSGKKVSGRVDNGGYFLPYWTREEIDTSTILRGNEIVYLSNRFDAFLLHIQGSGKIRLRDGSIRSVHYKANNGHPYSSIGKLFVDEDKMVLDEVNIPAIREYLINHPSELDRILYHNKRYIFFGWGGDNGPIGYTGEVLTPGRSIAIDANSLPLGTIAYLVSQKPVVNKQGDIIKWEQLQRFVFPQDTGAAIKGPGRVDLFWGNGSYAEIAAGGMKEKGYLYFLIKNNFEARND